MVVCILGEFVRYVSYIFVSNEFLQEARLTDTTQRNC